MAEQDLELAHTTRFSGPHPGSRRRSQYGRILLLASTLLSTLALGSAGAQDAPWARPVGSTSTELSDQGDSKLRTQVLIDADTLAADPERLVVELPDGESLVLWRTSSIDRGPGRLGWWGSFEPVDRQGTSAPATISATLSLRDGLVAGRIDTPSRAIAIEPRADRGHDLVTWTTANWTCGGTQPREPALPLAAQRWNEPSEVTQEGSGGAPTIDVLLLYTPLARDEEGGTAQMETILQNSVDTLTTSFANSNVNAQARLVGTALAPQFAELRNLNPFLRSLRLDPEVASLRAQTGADLVHMIVGRREANGSACGLAYLMLSGDTARSMSNFAFGTVAGNCNIQEVFAHEAGHNLGLNHDPVNTTVGDPDSSLVPFRPYAFGHSFSSRWKTIMSYGGQREIPYFSNPDLQRDGEPLGIPDERDNARTLRDTVSIGAAFWGAGGGGGGTPPASPSDLLATLVPPASAELSWVDNSDDETGFAVEMRPAGEAWQSVASTPADATSARVEALPPDSVIELRLRAVRGRSRSQPSNVVTIETTATSTLPPSLEAHALSTSSIELTWSPAAATEVARATMLAVDARSPVAGWQQVLTVTDAAGRAVVDELSAGSPYTFRLRASSTGLDDVPAQAPKASATTELASEVDCADPGPAAICLLDERFLVSVEWRNHLQANDSGVGRPVGIQDSDQSALFWFFDQSNIELVVKLLDGRPINDSFWAFFGALSDVEYWVTVRDLGGTNEGSRTYHNPPGELCGQADVNAFIEVPDVGASAPTSVRSNSAGVAPWLNRSGAPSAGTGQMGPCEEDEATLCLQEGRFAVQVEWDTPNEPGVTGVGSPLPSLGTNETGFFWFFEPGNVELSIKLLDGRAINDSFWFFWGGLSDVSYRILVRDTVSGNQSVYSNPAGTLCGGSDLEAF